MTDDSVYGPYGSGKGTLGKPKPGQQRSQPRMRMRERIVRWGTPKPPAPTQSVTDPLISVVLANHPKADTAIIERAYRTAEHYHRGQSRKSGDPYITHPLAVTMIVGVGRVFDGVVQEAGA